MPALEPYNIDAKDRGHTDITDAPPQPNPNLVCDSVTVTIERDSYRVFGAASRISETLRH